jgi:hypothetical protein
VDYQVVPDRIELIKTVPRRVKIARSCSVWEGLRDFLRELKSGLLKVFLQVGSVYGVLPLVFGRNFR